MGNGVNSLFSAFQGSHHVQISRPFIRKYLYAIFIGLLISLLLISSIIIYVLFEINILDNLSDQGIIKNEFGWLKVGEYVLLIIMTILIPAILYFFGTPERRKERIFRLRIYNGRNVHLEHLIIRSIYQHLFEL